jgi:hypothetical protein
MRNADGGRAGPAYPDGSIFTSAVHMLDREPRTVENIGFLVGSGDCKSANVGSIPARTFRK